MQLVINGSLGDEIALTAIPREIRRYLPHERILVTNRYPELFENNPHCVNDPYCFSDSDKVIRIPLNPNYRLGSLPHAYGQFLGFRVIDDTPELYLDDEVYEDQFGLSKYSVVIGIDTWAGWPKRRWPFEYFQMLVNQLREKHPDWAIVELGKATSDCTGALRPKVRLQNTTVTLVDKTPSIRKLAKMMQSLTLFIGNDSGLSHLAAAVYIPSVVLFGGMPWYSRAYRSTFPIFPYQSKCDETEGACIHTPHCMMNISPQTVESTVELALEKWYG